jgi:hypothetical protein
MPRKRKVISIGPATDIKLLALSDLDGRTISAKRAKALCAAIEEDLGGPDTLSTIQRTLCRRLACAVAISEHLEATWLAGGEIPVAELTTLLNSIARVGGQLGLQRLPRDVTTLADVVASGNIANIERIVHARYSEASEAQLNDPDDVS